MRNSVFDLIHNSLAEFGDARLTFACKDWWYAHMLQFCTNVHVFIVFISCLSHVSSGFPFLRYYTSPSPCSSFCMLRFFVPLAVLLAVSKILLLLLATSAPSLYLLHLWLIKVQANWQIKIFCFYGILEIPVVWTLTLQSQLWMLICSRRSTHRNKYPELWIRIYALNLWVWAFCEKGVSLRTSHWNHNLGSGMCQTFLLHYLQLLLCQFLQHFPSFHSKVFFFTLSLVHLETLGHNIVKPHNII